MSNKEIFFFLKPFLKNEKKLIIIAFLFALISSLIGVSYGYLSGKAISSVSDAAIKTGIFAICLNLFLIILNHSFFHRKSVIMMSTISFNVMERITFSLFEKVLCLPTKAFEEKSSGEFINRITNDSETITDAISSILNIGIRTFTSILVFFYCLFNSYIVAIEIVIYMLILYKISSKFGKKIKQYQKEIKTTNDTYISKVNESVHGIREIRALGINRNIITKIKKIVYDLFGKRKKSLIFEQNFYSLINILDEAFVALVFITCILEIIYGKGTLTFFVAMSYYIYNFMNLVNSFTSFSTYYQKLKVSVERIHEILNNKLYKDISFGNYHQLKTEGKLEFRDVSFKYHDNKKEILKHFNLIIEPNTKIAIIGKSGEGKSTIFNLLLRFFDSTKGKILLDDVDLSKYDEESLRKNISIIRQDPFLFNCSILENFKFVSQKMTLKEIRKYCKIALIDDYIMSLPKKYKTIIGEGGVNLSGGQKQRLAIARALAKNSKIILFDEATSALDNESQERIIKVVEKISKDHTIITIAHRLSTIINSDIIHIMEDGCIKASGTHDELLKTSTVYQDLYKNNA